MLTINTKAPAALLKKFEERIAQKELEGKIRGWIKVATGANAGKFTHVSDEHGGQAFFEAKVDEKNNALKFMYSSLDPKKKADQFTYGYYHGHLTLSFISNFEDDFDDVVSTAKVVQAKKK